MTYPIEPGDVLFLDTSFAIALVAASDALHEQAEALADQIEATRSRMITTRGVLLEIGNALSKRKYRDSSIRLLDSIQNDSQIEIVTITDDLFFRGFRLYRSRPDKEWGLVDCISFTVMTDRRLTKALTADEHFQQCGFQSLLRKNQ